MRPQNWDRLLYNLSFTHAVILYSEPNDPLVRYLSDIQDEYHLSYISNLKNQTDDKLIAQIAKQLFGTDLPFAHADLKMAAQQTIDRDTCYVVAINGLPSDNVINQLLQTMAYFAGRFSIVFEVNSVQVEKFIDNYPSQTVSIIGGHAPIKTNISVDEPASVLVKETKTRSARNNKLEHSKTKFVVFCLALTLVFAVFIGVLWTLLSDKPESLLEPIPSVEIKPSAPIVSESKVSQVAEQELDFVEQAIQQKDITAAEYFANRTKTNNEGVVEVASQPDTEQPRIDETQDRVERSVKTESTANSTLGQVDAKQSELTDELVLANRQVNSENEKQDPADGAQAEPEQNADEADSNSSYHDNAWYLSQSSQAYVIQLTLVSSEQVLAEYLAQLEDRQDIKVYASAKFFGVTYGIYQTQQEAIAAIKQLPDNLISEGAFAKPVVAIIKLINSSKTEF